MFGTIFSGFNQNAVNNQQLNFNKQLVGGAKTGELNEKEFMNLATYDQGTRKMEGEFLKDGTLSFSERRTLEQRNRQNQEMLNLYKRGDYSPETPLPQNGIEGRMQNQLRRTYQGLESGSLTYGEGLYTMNRQGEVATNYGKAQATPNGFLNTIMGRPTFTGGERQDIHRQLDANSQNLHGLKHNWAGDGGAPQFTPYGSYNPPVNFPSYPGPSMMNPGGMPQFQGGTPPYMSSFTQGMFAGMQMMQMMMMMQMMGMGMPLEMFGGGMPMGMNPFMSMGQNFPLGMNMQMGMSMGMGGMNFQMGMGMQWGNIQGNPNMQISQIANPQSKQQVGNMLEQAAAKYGVPTEILKAVAWNESRWNASAVGDQGNSHGVMQIYARAHPQAYQGVENVGNSAAKNIEYGAKLLRTLYDKYGSWEMAVKRYNGSGPMAEAYTMKVMNIAQNQPWRQAGLA